MDWQYSEIVDIIFQKNGAQLLIFQISLDVFFQSKTQYHLINFVGFSGSDPAHNHLMVYTKHYKQNGLILGGILNGHFYSKPKQKIHLIL